MFLHSTAGASSARTQADSPGYTAQMISGVECVILGSGTSAGVPVIGCACDVCCSEDPRDARLRTAACLQFVDPGGADRTFLIDTSPDLRQQVLRERIERCDGIFFTHNHVDHIFGLDEVRRFNIVMQSPIDIFADDHTMQSLYRVYRHIFEREKNVNDSFVATLIPTVIEAERPIHRFGLRILPIRLLHGRLPILGFRFDAVDANRRVLEEQPAPLPLAYCTDVSSIPPETYSHLADLRTLLLDMLRYRHHPTHMSVDQAVDAASRIGADRTWFVHMTHDIRHAELDTELPAGMALAYDGLRIAVDAQAARA